MVEVTIEVKNIIIKLFHFFRLKSDLDDKKRTIDRLNQELRIRRSSPAVHTNTDLPQTSPRTSLPSPPTVTRMTTPPNKSPREVSPTGVIEKMHKLNQTLMAENQFLRNKLKQNERYIATLKDELDLYNRMKNDSAAIQTSPLSPRQPLDLSEYMKEMRELRMRLEESIRTNDKLRAQLEKRMAGEDADGAKSLVLSSETSIQYIQDNERLRAELLLKDRTIDELKTRIDELGRLREM